MLLLRFALYPAVAPAPGTRIRMDRAVFGRGYFSMAGCAWPERRRS